MSGFFYCPADFADLAMWTASVRVPPKAAGQSSSPPAQATSSQRKLRAFRV